MRSLISFLLFVFLIPLLNGCSDSAGTLFKKIPSGKSGLFFNNTINENDSINPLKLEFLYNGGGVAIGDFNNDSLPDIYFTASTTSNKLFLNKKDLEFKEITTEAGVTGEGRWSNGATVVDINNDGWQDIYVCTSIKKSPEERQNLLYINQGVDSKGIPTFKEMAGQYGLADTSHSVQAAFFDYDRDGDLDMYLVTTKPTTRNSYTFGNRKENSHTDFDKIFQNNWSETHKHPIFTDVSTAAGINENGYGLGITVGDINNDGWADIYVTNDFITSDHMYINRRNGTFSNNVRDCFRHTSQNAMGNDIVDINNDAWPDILAVDMNPEDNFRKQKNMGAANYGKYRNMADFGYSLQFVRNTLQINQGAARPSADSVSIPVFSDIAYYAGVAESDWSWSPSVADFDNDGLRDILITNGYPKDVTDHDYVSYRQDKGYIVSDKELLKQIPEIKVANYAFRNTESLVFENVSKAWGLDDDAYSTGAAYADLDNDGDLDYVINNINGEASLYENTSDPLKNTGNGFIRLKFTGDASNKDGVGVKATAFYNGKPHVYEHYPTRGYLSSMELVAHFGLGNSKIVDSIIIQWHNGKSQTIHPTKINQIIRVDIRDAVFAPYQDPETGHSPLFSAISEETGIDFKHSEFDYIDFNYQRLLPHKLSEYGPALAAGDVDGNGLDDLFLSGPKGKAGVFFLQQANGRFIQKPLQLIKEPIEKPFEELGSLLLDIDNDDDLDLYLCSGSNEFKQGDSAYRDRIFLNDGKANFIEKFNVLPQNLDSKQVLKSADFDNDGDMDLFIGSRSIPNEFPKKASGYLYRNDSQSGSIKFTDVSKSLAPQLARLGMITDAVWSDFNNDGRIDLVICGEFMPVQFFKNNNGRFEKINVGSDSSFGLWNSISAADIDNNGHMDYIVGNVGLNSFYKGTQQHPFEIYGSDFDNNGSYDAIPFLFLKDNKGQLGQYPAFTRDDMIKQLWRIKGQFPTYKDFANAGLTNILTGEERNKAEKASANYMQSAIFKNLGNGKFSIIPLPYQTQWSPVYGILPDDFDSDGNIDLLMNTNDLGTEVSTGQYDALNGIYLKGDGKGNFKVQSYRESGYFIPSNGKAIVKFIYHGQYAVASSQNKDSLKLFKLNGTNNLIRLQHDDLIIDILLENGAVRREEVYHGNTFLAQSSRFINITRQVQKVKITNSKGKVREIKFN